MNESRGLRWVLTLRCREASELASRELDEPLSRIEGYALKGHVLICTSCRRFRRQILQIRRAMQLRDAAAGSGPDSALSDEARRRIARAIDEADLDRV